MAYQNTGYARNTTLTVTKGDYSQSYNITAAFTDPADQTEFETLTPQEFQRLSDADYEVRLQAFCRHVYDEEDSLEADCPDLTRGSVEYNPTMCPVPIVVDADGPPAEE